MPFKDPNKKRAYMRAFKKKQYAEAEAPSGICSRYPDCKKPTQDGKRKCETCLAYMRAYKLQYRAAAQAAKSAGVCSKADCKNAVTGTQSLCPSCRAGFKKQNDLRRLELNEIQNTRNRQNKLEVIVAYGGKCVCCGVAHPELLSIDHIDGYASGPRKGAPLYAWLKRNNFPDGFRVLCMTCNFTLGHHGYCPHGRLTQKTRAGRPRIHPEVPGEAVERRAYWAMYKLEVINQYGGPRCVCCGEAHLECLSIDHIDGDGAEHRRDETQARNIYIWLRQNHYPPGFRVLCHGCNFAFGHFGACPHQQAVT